MVRRPRLGQGELLGPARVLRSLAQRYIADGCHYRTLEKPVGRLSRVARREFRGDCGRRRALAHCEDFLVGHEVGPDLHGHGGGDRSGSLFFVSISAHSWT